MIVKLVNPRGGQAMTFQCAGEVYYEGQGAITLPQQEGKVRDYEAQGYEPRRYVAWAGNSGDGEKVELTEIIMPAGGPLKRAVVILTNFDAYLCNDNGRTIDRIHRYLR